MVVHDACLESSLDIVLETMTAVGTGDSALDLMRSEEKDAYHICSEEVAMVHTTDSKIGVAFGTELTNDAVAAQASDTEDDEEEITYITVLASPNATSAATTAPPTPCLPCSPSLPHHPSEITILCNHSPVPFTLATHLLTTHSRLFATLAHDPSSFSPSTLHLNIDHDTFTIFARWLQGGRVHAPEGDENGFATDLYVLMRAHATGEALGAGTFADMVLDEIIGELTQDERCVSDGESQRSIDSEVADARGKAHDLEILLQAAAAIWPPGSLGRDLLVDWYVHSSASKLQNLSIEGVVEIGDLDLAARCMVLGKERQMLFDAGEAVQAPYLLDPCRYHSHRQMGDPCYKRSSGSVFSRLEFAVRSGIRDWDDDDEDVDSGFGGDATTLQEYEACVEESMIVFDGDGEGDGKAEIDC